MSVVKKISSIRSCLKAWVFWIALAAVLLMLGRPPFRLYHLSWFALVPWFFVLRRAVSAKEALLAGLLLAVFTTFLNESWIAIGAERHFHLARGLAWVGLALYGVVNQLQFLIFSLIGFWVLRRGCPPSVFWALLYVGLDGVLPRMHEDRIGNHLYPFTDLRQIADLGGISLLTFLVFFVNFSIWRTLEARRLGRLVPGMVALLAAFGYGNFRNSEIHRALEEPHEQIRVRIIQGNFNQLETLSARPRLLSEDRTSLLHYLKTSRQAAESSGDPELLIWPEASNPRPSFYKTKAPFGFDDKDLSEFLRSHPGPLLFGSLDLQGHELYNSVFLANATPTPSSSSVQVYHKNFLVPFAEKDLRTMIGVPALRGDMKEDSEYRTLEVTRSNEKRLRISPLLCLESGIPGSAFRGARQGSDFILTLSNDSWFAGTQLPEIHLIGSTFRSIETRQPQIFAGETGISALILPDGSIAHRTQSDRAAVMDVDVPLIGFPLTLATFIARGVSWIALMISGGVFWRFRKSASSARSGCFRI